MILHCPQSPRAVEDRTLILKSRIHLLRSNTDPCAQTRFSDGLRRLLAPIPVVLDWYGGLTVGSLRRMMLRITNPSATTQSNRASRFDGFYTQATLEKQKSMS